MNLLNFNIFFKNLSFRLDVPNNSIKQDNKHVCKKMLTTNKKLLVNNMAELISVRAGEKAIDIFANENVET